MRKIPKPIFNSEHVFLECISKVNDDILKRQLTSISGQILTASNTYETAVVTNTLHTLPTSNNVGGVPVKEMKKVYTYRMVNKKQAGRPYYDAILASAPYGKCPLCNQRIASTLDHHLPKSDYPEYVVSPINLIPSCKDCNTIKDAYSPNTSNEETLHPYYDDIESEQWLFASINNNDGIVIEFFTDKPSCWTELLGERIKNHFEILQLAELYSAHAGEELSNILYQLNILYNEAGEDAVRAHLYENYLSRYQHNKNSWQTAMYKALSENNWFCGGGLVQLTSTSSER